MKAHYFATKNVKYVVLSEGPRPVGERIKVSGKADARALAKARNATPYNF